uniref:Interleukin 1 receptor associated kinase 1 binding protein 1 n=1 Tax=Cavia porcellus TaxID=10141 RepID=A0A286XAM8_CAVPO
MSLPQAPPSRVFVELVPWADRSREKDLVSSGEALPGTCRPSSSAQAQIAPREVHVSGTAAVSARPDRAQVVVRVSSTKEAAAEAKKSVSRRLDYVAQSLRQWGVQAENITTTKDFRRVENAYHMEAEVNITFTDFGKMQDICNFRNPKTYFAPLSWSVFGEGRVEAEKESLILASLCSSPNLTVGMEAA